MFKQLELLNRAALSDVQAIGVENAMAIYTQVQKILIYQYR